jgi:Glycosyl transferases group 1
VVEPASKASRRALRILHISNFGYKAKGVFGHGVPQKLSNGWTRSGHNVVNFSDRDVARWAGPFDHRKWGTIPANRILYALALDIRPDVIAVGHADVISPRTIARIREKLPQTRVLLWTVDALFIETTLGRFRGRGDVADAIFASTGGAYLEAFKTGRRVAGFLPNPVDPSIERLRNFELPAQRLPYDVMLACHVSLAPRIHCGIERTPDELARAMQAAVKDLNPSFHGVLGAPTVFGPAYEEALAQTRMGLNFSHRNDLELYSSDRLSHIAGNGLVVLIDRATGYGTLFDDKMFAFYSSEPELFETIARLKRDDAARRRMAEAGWRRYHRLFSSEIIAQYMLDALFGVHDPSKYEWPTLV